VLDFWFGRPGDPAFGQFRQSWFKKDAAFDELVRTRFGALHEAVAAASIELWKASAQRALAYVIVLDQMSRNLFRDTPRAFAYDAHALAMARDAVAGELDRALRPLERSFLYMPFEHSEALADQARSVELFESLRPFAECAATIPYAQMHYDVIARFGRFPHRNPILGRASTPEEIEYLSDPGAGF
jgi:uncharacterized protein (DUF924 family)